MAKRFSVNRECNLLPFEREDLLTIQDVEQKVGWEITAFNLPEAWKYSQGEGVVVAVLDTGADLDHDDLVCNLIPGRNFLKPGTPPEDDNGHGSHVAGIIAACNNDLGVVGVAPKAKIMPVKVLDHKGSGNLFNTSEAIRWVADQNVNFIAMSLGSPQQMPMVRSAIQYAAEKGCVTFCAAGNAGNTRQIFYPAAYPETIGIGAIDSNFDRAKFSCSGPDLDFVCPGVDICSTVPDNWYAVLSGTSMANPFAVGLACLLLSYKKQKNLNIPLGSAKDYVEFMKKYTIPTKDFNGQKFFEGFGIIDPRKLEEWIKQN